MAKTYVDHIQMGGVIGYFRETLSGAGAPTASTEGFVGLRYYDTEAKTEYICTSAEGGYTWEPYTAGGGGISPHIGANGNWFVGETDTGVKAQGEDGKPGYTPQKGVDYYTEDDKTEMVNDVLAALPTWEGGSY